MNNCPQCQVPVSEADNECPKCGILFSKWKERESNVASGNLSKYSAIANATSSEFNWTILIIVAGVVAGIIYFMSQNAKELLKDI
jgi:uncharacterized membrane protein YvbJ